MRNTKSYLVKQFASKVLFKKDLLNIKGGGSKVTADLKRCEKAWRDAIALAELEGKTIKKVSGNGNGIW